MLASTASTCVRLTKTETGSAFASAAACSVGSSIRVTPKKSRSRASPKRSTTIAATLRLRMMRYCVSKYSRVFHVLAVPSGETSCPLLVGKYCGAFGSIIKFVTAS